MTPSERHTVTPFQRDYLTGLSERQLTKLKTDSVKALRLAWPNRNGLRARIVIQSNVTMLRNIRSL